MTNAAGRFALILITIATLFCLTGARVKTVANRWTEQELSYALRVASQDASAVLIHKDQSMGGNEADSENIVPNMDDALDQFKKAFAVISARTFHRPDCPT